MTEIYTDDIQAKSASGDLRLGHWLCLIALAFAFGITIVWLQVSSVRLGYLIVEEERRVEILAAEVAHARAEIERLSSPLALAALADAAKLELESGRAHRREGTKR